MCNNEDQWNCCGLWPAPLSCVWADPFLKLKRGNCCHSWLMCCFSLLSKTGPALNRWNEGTWSLWPEGAWGLSDHIVQIATQEQSFIHRGKKKRQLHNPYIFCTVPGHPTLDQAGCDNVFRCLKNKCALLCLATRASWLPAVSCSLL